MTREQLLREAIAVSKDRAKSHGAFDEGMEKFAEFLTAYFRDRKGICFGPSEAAVICMLLKISRLANSDHSTPDTWIDLANYAAQAGHLAITIPSSSIAEELDKLYETSWEEAIGSVSTITLPGATDEPKNAD